MKKLLALFECSVFIIILITGCSTQAEVKKFDGEIKIDWQDVEYEFTTIEKNANKDVKNVDEFSADELKVLVNDIDRKYDQIKNGVTKENHEVAKDIYRDAHKIEAFAMNADESLDNDVTKLAASAKSLVKHYYGEADEDYDKVKKEFEKELDKVKKFDSAAWNKIEDEFKK